jgi:hypothetical protein
MSEVGCQRSEVGCQMSEVGCQRSEVGGRSALLAWQCSVNRCRPVRYAIAVRVSWITLLDRLSRKCRAASL